MKVDRYEVREDRIRIEVDVSSRTLRPGRDACSTALIGGVGVIPYHSRTFIESKAPFKEFEVEGGTFQVKDVPELIKALEGIVELASESTKQSEEVE